MMTVSFGTFGSAHHYLLGGLVQDFRKQHPNVRFKEVSSTVDFIHESYAASIPV